MWLQELIMRDHTLVLKLVQSDRSPAGLFQDSD